VNEPVGLREELERERALFADGPVVVFRWRAVDGWPVEFVSSNVRELFGWADHEFVSGAVAYASVVHPEDLGRVADEVGRHAAAGAVHFGQDYRIVARDGTVRWLYDQTRVVRDATGSVTHFLGYVFDVTDRRRVEEELAAARRVEALGRLAGGIAHDFNNLLTAVAGHLDLAAAHLPDDHPSRGSVAVARRTVDRGAALTAQLLALARADEPQPRPVRVDAAVRETLDLVAPLLGDSVRVQLELAAHPAAATVDPGQLQQVLLNLLVNARDAMPDGGLLQVCTRADGDRVVLTITDSGRGMDEATAARAFEPFFSTRAGGTGLGLSTVRSIVERSQGALALRTRPGAGSEFEITLPRALPAGTPSRPPPDAAPAPARILVAEDHGDIREFVAEVLSARGHEVRAAASGEAALELAVGWSPGLVVTDVSMPGMSGAALVEALVARGWSGPALFVSGHVRHVELPEGPDRALLRKPFGIEVLVEQVSRLLNRSADPGAGGRRP
jgi:PAS domain S-box-containing protein